ncbi:MAG: rRNA pseudouridine synthase [Lachnospiraceae bacterium]|jgi:23S rRNA pseudouridine2605 synthase|nr:rRNA pseudouridine synthase [Lachnospiraceae bacterium]
MEIRLQKYLADCGVASRRKCEEYILEGRVKVNGQVVTTLGTKVDADTDKIEYNNVLIKDNKNAFTYILLNKPIGYVTTVEDQFNRDTVLDLVKTSKRLVPVGRLDMYTSGALILTDDGDFVYKVTHPKHEINKTYIVTVKGTVEKEEIEQLKNGVQIDEYTTKPAKVKIININEEKNQTRVVITIHEGRNRQVRKMCEAIGKTVIALHRSKIGEIDVKDIPLGKWRYLTEDEVKHITNSKL